MGDDEMVVRFFGMKDHDRMLKIAVNLSRSTQPSNIQHCSTTPDRNF